MNLWTLPGTDLSGMDELMYENGLLRVVPSEELLKFPVTTIQLWCVQRGVYQLPTRELIDWLKAEMGDNAIEICSGFGVIGRALNIPRTDSYMQTKPEMAEYYESLGQKPINPPADVMKMSANTAVKILRPSVVIGAWVTQLWQEGDDFGSVEGVDEVEIYKDVKKYIHVGNDSPHKNKRIYNLPHKTYRFPWLVSRAKEQRLNFVKTWEH